jgi:hypothetical protein
LKYQGKNRFFTKFTGPPRICYLNSIFPDAHYIHVIRDPRGVVFSLLKVKFWREGHGLLRPWWRNGMPHAYLREWKASGRSSAALAAVQWKRVVEQTWEEKELISPESFLEVRYEDFTEDPHEILSLVFEKLHLPDSDEAHRYVTSIGKLRNMNYKYKKYLHVDDVAMIKQCTCQTAKRAGYSFNN